MMAIKGAIYAAIVCVYLIGVGVIGLIDEVPQVVDRRILNSSDYVETRAVRSRYYRSYESIYIYKVDGEVYKAGFDPARDKMYGSEDGGYRIYYNKNDPNTWCADDYGDWEVVIWSIVKIIVGAICGYIAISTFKSELIDRGKDYYGKK